MFRFFVYPIASFRAAPMSVHVAFTPINRIIAPITFLLSTPLLRYSNNTATHISVRISK